jgi:hypothetical protein
MHGELIHVDPRTRVSSGQYWLASAGDTLYQSWIGCAFKLHWAVSDLRLVCEFESLLVTTSGIRAGQCWQVGPPNLYRDIEVASVCFPMAER